MDENRIIELLNRIKPIAHEIEKQRKEKQKNGENFNVFSIIGLKRQEVRLHSAFLAELLNPKGSHGLKGSFLREFLACLGLEENYLDSDKVHGRIVERSIGKVTDTTGGRLDIIIEDGNHAIIIENKIDARDRPNQLLRYYNYAESSSFKDKYQLLYLTLDGHEASGDSTGKAPINYRPISYKGIIIEWLEKCLLLSKNSSRVFEGIQQYLSIIRNLTNQDMNEVEKNKIVDAAIKDMEAVQALMDVRSELAKRLRKVYINDALSDYCKSHSLQIKIEHKEYPCITIRKEGWTDEILVRSNKKQWSWVSMYICIYDESGKQSFSKLDCFDEQPQKNYPYGWEWLSCSNWHSEDSFLKIKNGEVAKEITEKLEEILAEKGDL